MTGSIRLERGGFVPAVAATTVILVLFLFFAACARVEDENRITFALWGTPEQERAARELIRAFGEHDPEIEVELLVMGYGRYFDRLQAMMIGQVAPDVMMIGVNYYDEWLARGILLDVTDDFHELEKMGEVMPVAREAVERGGRIYGYPVNITGVVTCVNLDAFRQAGIDLPEDGQLSWEDIMEMAPRLSARHGDPNAPTDYAMILPSLIVFFWQEGLDLFDDPYDPAEVTINHPRAVAVIERIRELHRRGWVVPPEVGLDEGYRELFRDGRVAIFFDNLIGSLMFYDRTGFEWDILPFPEGSESNVSALGSMSLGIWSNSPNQEAARKFARFCASPEGARLNMRSQRWQPIYRKIAYGDEFRAMGPPPSMHRFSEMMEEGASRPILYAPGLQTVNRIFTDRMSQALSEPERPAEVILGGLEDDLNRWLSRQRQ